MKKYLVAFTVILMTSLGAHAAQSFKGSAAARGDFGFNCQDISYPRTGDAEADADQQASEFCDSFSMISARTSDFVYSYSGCMTEGPGYARATVEYTYATAEYRCLPKTY